jgi:hypothetical protein
VAEPQAIGLALMAIGTIVDRAFGTDTPGADVPALQPGMAARAADRAAPRTEDRTSTYGSAGNARPDPGYTGLLAPIWCSFAQLKSDLDVKQGGVSLPSR